MEFVFGTWWWDLLLTLLLGAIGGFVLGLLNVNGLELPRHHQENGIKFYDLGFLADVVIGLVAAFLIYVLNRPIDKIHFIASAITSGIGGSAILRGFVEGTRAKVHAIRARNYHQLAVDCINRLDKKARLAELEKADPYLS